MSAVFADPYSMLLSHRGGALAQMDVCDFLEPNPGNGVMSKEPSMSFTNIATCPCFVPNLTHRDGLAIAGLLSRHADTANAPAAATDVDLNAMTAAQLREALKQFLVSPPAKEGGRAM